MLGLMVLLPNRTNRIIIIDIVVVTENTFFACSYTYSITLLLLRKVTASFCCVLVCRYEFSESETPSAASAKPAHLRDFVAFVAWLTGKVTFK